LVSGVIDVATQDGIVRMIAPCDCVTKPGTRKIAYVLEDALMVTYHANPDECRDIAEIENKLFKAYDNPLLKEAKMEVIK
jgi:hypothetical protein